MQVPSGSITSCSPGTLCLLETEHSKQPAMSAAAHLVDTTNGSPPMWSRWACVTNTFLLYTARCVQRPYGLPCPAVQSGWEQQEPGVALAHLRAAAGVKHQLMPRQDDAGLLTGDADAVDFYACQSEGRLPPCVPLVFFIKTHAAHRRIVKLHCSANSAVQ